jgi:hypothetical protein
MQGTRVQNSSDPTQVGATESYDSNILCNGPSTISVFITNNAATSTACKATVSYVDSGAN